MAGSTVLRTFMYDTNTLDSTFSGSYTAGRLVAVQHTAFTPQGYLAGQGGSNITVPSSMQFVEMYGYTQAGLTSGKRLQVQETLHYYLNGVAQNSPQTLNLDAAYTYDSEGKMTSVNYPETWSWQGQNGPLVSAPGPTYTYSFDTMDRPTGLKDQNNNTVVNNVTYNAANQLLTFNTETRTYNNLNQMTRLTITGTSPLDISYNFPAGANNGKISSQKDNLSGETVTYQYDSLNRLISASSSQSWSETYGFDAFGNLLSKTPAGGAPTLSQSVNPATNQIVGQTYDSNGNQTTGSLGTVYYDAENRIAGVSTAGIQYASDSRNKRIWRGTLSSGNLAQQVYFYGVDGQKLGTYTFSLGQYGEGNTPEMTNSTVLLATFFGSKRIGTFDRLGTAKYNPNGQVQSFYPYGEDRGTVEPNDSLKFATYTRDTATGLDYADQRYYASNFGRFMSPDPYRASSRGPRPQSWNRYTYVQGDPVNFNDRRGLDLVLEDEGDDGSFDGDGGDQEDFGSGGGGGGGCGPGWETDASLSGPCCPTSGSGLLGDPTPAPPNPACYAPPPPAPEPEPPAPECDTQVRSAPIAAGKVHTYLYVTGSNGVSDVLEGVFSGSTFGMLAGRAYLNGSVSLDGAVKQDDPSNYQKNPLDFDFASLLDVNGLTEEELCYWVQLLIGFTNDFPTDTVRYNWAGQTNPNSNSFTRWLLEMIGTTLPEPKGAIGWNHKIFGN